MNSFRISDVAYFGEPFPLEPWLDNNGKPIRGENSFFSLPLRITEKKESIAEAIAALKAAVLSRKSGKVQKVSSKAILLMFALDDSLIYLLIAV